jgi:hypothetical protein
VIESTLFDVWMSDSALAHNQAQFSFNAVGD